MAQQAETECVLHEKIATAQGACIGHLTLNAPATLNSLTLAMVEQLQQQLDAWQCDDEIACIVISGSGEKAFCAGGDVQMLRQSAIDNPGGPCVEAENFFAREYRMNYSLHTYRKPVIAWGSGIVMGGGLGMLAGASHRVVTETSRFAMPEITIALYPDVGGSYFLNQMPGQCGRFLALTGASFNAADALYTGVADYFIQREKFSDLLAALQSLPSLNADSVDELLCSWQAQSLSTLPAGQVEAHGKLIDTLCADNSLPEAYAAIKNWQGDDKWMAKARDGLLHGSPLAALWIDAQLQRSKGKPLADIFRSELVLSTNIIRHPEFAEGVRALLIDKDRQPKWQFPGIDAVPADFVERFFAPPWQENPLADL